MSARTTVGARLLGITTDTQVPRRPVCSVSAGIRKLPKLKWKPALAQSGERIHGKENPGAILLGR